MTFDIDAGHGCEGKDSTPLTSHKLEKIGQFDGSETFYWKKSGT